MRLAPALGENSPSSADSAKTAVPAEPPQRMIITAVAVAVTAVDGSIVPKGKVVALPGRNLQLLEETTNAPTDSDCASLSDGQIATMHNNAASVMRQSEFGVASNMDTEAIVEIKIKRPWQTRQLTKALCGKGDAELRVDRN